ncbi:unnamed protein product [Brassica napus]|uniref:(rape) hypothetical protein n=1 Tax=Brassica napus TaxID=3708 RepID=A0A816M6Y6_BRANA|nr:unnamed protein product [Brassica napus]
MKPSAVQRLFLSGMLSKEPFQWISPAPTSSLFLPLSESAMFLSMAMMVTTPPSCLRSPPDPPPSFLGFDAPLLLLLEDVGNSSSSSFTALSSSRSTAEQALSS